MSIPTPSERTLIARIAASESWSHTPDRSARTAPARAALLAKFETQVDPEGSLPPGERAIRAEHARKAYFSRLALKSAQARRKAKDLTAAAVSAEAELEQLGGPDAA
jgi:hypothetical protein